MRNDEDETMNSTEDNAPPKEGAPVDGTTGDENQESAESSNQDAISQSAIDDLMGDFGVAPMNSGLPQQEFASSSNNETVEARPLEAVYEVPVQLSAVLGKAHMPVNQLLKLGRGAVVELDRRVGEAIEIYVNNKLIARGEVVLVDDRLGVTMTEIIKADKV